MIEHKIGMKVLKVLDNEFWQLIDLTEKSERNELAEIIERETHVKELIDALEFAVEDLLNGGYTTRALGIKQLLAKFKEDETK